jgi:hypothetical protein
VGPNEELNLIYVNEEELEKEKMDGQEEVPEDLPEISEEE